MILEDTVATVRSSKSFVNGKQDDIIDSANNQNSSGILKEGKQRHVLLEDAFDVAPSGLRFCFDREYFLNDDFHPDVFILTEERRGSSLEKLRDSLLQYSNILKSSLVELINQDYADFVNLSSNLVGLDKGIDQISAPLHSFQASTLAVIKELDTVEHELTAKLQERQGLRDKKDLLNSLRTLGECVTRLERWLTPQPPDHFNGDAPDNSGLILEPAGRTLKPEPSSEEALLWPTEFYADFSLHEDPGQRIDRVATEYVKLQFFAKKCHDHPIVQSMKPRIQWITTILQEQLEMRLKYALDAAHFTNDSGGTHVSKQAGTLLRQAFSTYLVIDRLSDLVQLYRLFVLRPKLSKIFTSRPELVTRCADRRNAVKALTEMYTDAQNVLSHQLAIIHQLSVQQSAESYDPLTEFDCLVDAFWPECVDLLCAHLPDMFDPGDPDRFYELYSVSQSFISQLESKITSVQQLKKFRNSSAYTDFENKWSLPVYFQIRLQEIAGKFENSIQEELTVTTSDSEGCMLMVTEVLLNQLRCCWKPGVYICNLRHRFLRLTLQLLSRYTEFVKSVSQQRNPATQKLTVDHLIHLLVDVHRVVSCCESELLALIQSVLGPIPTEQSVNGEPPTWLRECLAESVQKLLAETKPLSNLVLRETEQACLSTSRMILDVPRQYRRTNRSLPTTPSAYLSDMISPLRHIAELSAKVTCTGAISALSDLVRQCIIKVAEVYMGQLTEVLNAVKKMEDSLRKLREVRRGGSSASANQVAPLGSYSDDDKIRHQLYLDACAFREQVSALWGADVNCEDQLKKIVQLTQLVTTE